MGPQPLRAETFPDVRGFTVIRHPHCFKDGDGILNCYGPCSDRQKFWTQLADSGILSLKNLIIGGDLNIILAADEAWGGSYLPNSSEDFYKALFAQHNLIDVRPSRLSPTWRNGRIGTDAIARRLDRFLVAGNFLSSPVLPSSWVQFPYFSDHAPIFLHLSFTELHNQFPFKFNHDWLKSTDYSELVTSVWLDPIFLSEDNPQLRLTWKLRVLKSKTKSWFLRHKSLEQSRLLSLETEISNLISGSSISALSLDESSHLKLLESNRNAILLNDENCWRLRSRATWLKSGDANTRYFHKLASYNRNKKLIQSINSMGAMLSKGRRPLRKRPLLIFLSFTKPLPLTAFRRKLLQPDSSHS
jgi:hypothetical protein